MIKVSGLHYHPALTVPFFLQQQHRMIIKITKPLTPPAIGPVDVPLPEF